MERSHDGEEQNKRFCSRGTCANRPLAVAQTRLRAPVRERPPSSDTQTSLPLCLEVWSSLGQNKAAARPLRCFNRDDPAHPIRFGTWPHPGKIISNIGLVSTPVENSFDSPLWQDRPSGWQGLGWCRSNSDCLRPHVGDFGQTWADFHALEGGFKCGAVSTECGADQGGSTCTSDHPRAMRRRSRRLKSNQR